MPSLHSFKTLPQNIEELVFYSHGYSDRWEMTKAERCALIMLLQEIRPGCAIEIGTSQGGSLSAIAKFSQTTYTLDTDLGCRERLSPQYPHVDFITGRSQETLVPLLERLRTMGKHPDFILIDGDHSREGVKQDINNILKFRVTQPLYVLMHDSFNPDCRQGILHANWADNPHVHFLELDFVTGVLHTHAEFYRQMWGGLALAALLPHERQKELRISLEQEHLYQIVFKHSAHSAPSSRSLLSFAHAFRQKIVKIISGKFQRKIAA